jgi:ATP-dependent Clp protease ATP-binding subunit ClpC
VGFEPNALRCAVQWSARYLSGQMLPEKAINIVDLAGAKARRRGLERVTRTQVAEVVSELAQVPMDRLLETDGERMMRLEATLADSVVGHSAALARMASILRRNAAGLGGQRPIGTFLLLGPTGVGKTETAKAIASALFGSSNALTRLDLSEYSEAHAVARLIGAPPGYVGHEAGGQLTSAVRRRPYQVLLLDEIEKAHQDVLETFLPLFDEGRLTDGRGRTVDFTNTVIVLTSNIGAREATKGSARVGFGQRGQRSNAEERVVAQAREQLSPEFFNRLDEVLVFDALAEPEVEEIARRLLQRLADTVYQQRSIELDIDAAVVQLLLQAGGYDAALGARPMKRAIARHVEAPLAELLLGGKVAVGERVQVRAEAGVVRFIRNTGRSVAAE